MPKKKLPTGPIRIEPGISSVRRAREESQLTQPSQAQALEDEVALKLESKKEDSGNLESTVPESTVPDSGNLESTVPESTVPDSGNLESTVPDSGNLESTVPESTSDVYQKVAMKLTEEAANLLKQFRVTYGIPYEILVDVMIRNWDKLPSKTRNAYLSQAKQARAQRLMAGQEKTIQTMRQKYLS